MNPAAVVLVPLVALLGCRQGGAAAAKGDAGFPGHPSPPLDVLVGEAGGKQPPPSPGVPYQRPAPIEVPPLVRSDLSALPQDGQGRPVLNEMYGITLRVNTNLRDPVTAKGTCIALATHCVQRADVPAARTLDACWASTPRCATEQPWLESSDCCPPRCIELYERLRQIGYARFDAASLTMDSNCFNGLKEFLAVGR